MPEKKKLGWDRVLNTEESERVEKEKGRLPAELTEKPYFLLQIYRGAQM